jgi:hypothetical protein
MDDDETVKSFSIKPDGYLVLVKQTPGKPKPPVCTFSLLINYSRFYSCSQRRRLMHKDSIIIWE